MVHLLHARSKVKLFVRSWTGYGSKNRSLGSGPETEEEGGEAPRKEEALSCYGTSYFQKHIL